MKNSFKIFLLFFCLLTLANCRRNGPMGGGPMEGAGPCRRCNNLARNPNNQDFIRERNPNFLAPFPNNNPNNLGALDLGNNLGELSDSVESQDILPPGIPHSNGGTINPSNHR